MVSSADEVLKMVEGSSSYWLDLTFEEATPMLEKLAKVGPPLELLSNAISPEGPNFFFDGSWCIMKLPAVTKARMVIHRGLSLVLNDKVILSIHTPDAPRSKIEMEASLPLFKTGTGHVVYNLADGTLDDLEDLLERADEELSKIEDEALEISKTGDVRGLVRSLVIKKRELLLINKELWQLKYVSRSLRRASPHFLDKTVDRRLGELDEEVDRQIELIEMYRMLFADIMNVQTNALSARLNAAVKDLTYITLWITFIATLIGFPNTVATILGTPLGEFLRIELQILLLLGSAILPLIWLKTFFRLRKKEWTI